MDELYINVKGETYINVPALYSLDADVYIVFGERSGGKSYSVWRGMLTDFCRDGSQFCYLRTREDYLKGGKALRAVADHIKWIQTDMWKDESQINYRLGAYLKQSLGRNGKMVNEEMGYTMSIAAWIKYKSNSYPGVKTIFLDEFIEDIETRTIIPLSETEFIKGWMNNLSTIIRRRTDVRVVCCANSLNPRSPLFKYYGIDARKLEQGKTYMFTDKRTGLKICCHYTLPIDHAEPDKHISVYESKETEMAVGGAWQENRYPDSWLGKKWTWYGNHYPNSSAVYISDYKITLMFPRNPEQPLLICRGRYGATGNVTFGQLFLPGSRRLLQMMLYYKEIGGVINDLPETGEKFNDLTRRLVLDKK